MFYKNFFKKIRLKLKMRKIKSYVANSKFITINDNIITMQFDVINVKEQLKNNIKKTCLEFNYENNTLTRWVWTDVKEVEKNDDLNIDVEINRELIRKDVYYRPLLTYLSYFLLSEENEEYILTKADKAQSINNIFSIFVELGNTENMSLHLKCKNNYLVEVENYINHLTYLILKLK